MPNIILYLILVCLGLVQTACQTNDRNSILVIAVDDLAFSDANCSQESDPLSGLATLCKESVRFTHAFTPSTLTNPALTSLLTAKYPLDHNVHHNGAPPLAAQIDTVAELALKHDYRTSLFSGGAPLFRKTGLNQGFEVFDDNINPSFSNLFRPFVKNTEYFLQWLDQDVGRDSFLSVIYVPDLAFTTTQTSTELGEARNLSYESQLDEFDENLYKLITAMKDQNRWQRTTVILVGLNGHAGSSRPQEFAPLNVHSENTQVALLIKPAQAKKRDEAIFWKVDRNVSLVDVGQTLMDLIGETKLVTPNNDFQTFSLANALRKSGTEIPADRSLLIESGWALWRKAGAVRTALLSNFALYLNDEPPKLFNTLVDRLETNPLPLLQESLLPTTQKLQRLVEKNRLASFNGLDQEWRAKVSIPYSRWMRADQESQLLTDLKVLQQRNPRSLDILNWTAQIALNQRDWQTLKHLGQKNSMPNWSYVADKNLNGKNANPADQCFSLLKSDRIESGDIKDCSDNLFIELVDWLRADARGLNREDQRKKFERSFRVYMLDQLIHRTNIAMGFIWDINQGSSYSPSRTELALHLPEYAKFRTQVYKSLTIAEESY